MKIPFVKLNKEAKVPTKATVGSNGYDLYACFDEANDLSKTRILTFDHHPLSRTIIPTGIKVAIPTGYTGLVCPKSGLAIRNGLTVLNGPGVIDSDYRGEIGVILINEEGYNQTITHGQKVAQLLVVKTEDLEFEEVETLDQTVRGAGGFGSTGK